MIHFRCRCGRTLSAADAESGREVACEGCGGKVTVPARVEPAAAAAGRSRPGPVRHDFDAEIVGAARSTPPRPLKTPEPSPTAAVEEEADAEGASRPPSPGFDLLRVRHATRWLPLLGGAALVFGLSGAVASLFLLRGTFLLRGAVALALLAAGAGAFAGLVALRELARAVLGLADGQRDLARRLLSRDEPPGGSD